jgi:hypothetical protein
MPTPHSTDNYAIGKGILYIAEWSGTTPPTDPADFSDMGNASSIEIEPTVERLAHYSSRTGLRTKDKNPVIQSEYMVTFELDEIAAANVARYLMGEVTGAKNHIVYGMTQTDQEYALKFVSDNPLGPNQTWKFHRGTMTPNGAMQLIGEEWMVMSYNFEGLSDTANNPSSPYHTVTYVTTTTTTTV